MSGIAHQLKGAAGGYGYPTLSELAFDVEQLAKQDAAEDQIEDSLSLLIEQCHRAIAGVRSSESKPVAVDSEPADQSASAAAFGETATSSESVVAASPESVASRTEIVSDDVQSEILESVHQDIPKIS